MNYRRLVLYFLFFLLATTAYLQSSVKSYAHPVDNTYTYLVFDKTSDGIKLKDNEIYGYYYINWFIVGGLYFAKYGKEPQSFEELASHIQLVQEYVPTKTKIFNNGIECDRTLFTYPDSGDANPLDIDAEVIFKYTCSSQLENVKIENTLAGELFPLISNYISISKFDNELEKITLGKTNTVLEFNVAKLTANPVGDISVDYSAGYSDQQVIGETNNQGIKDTMQSNSSSTNVPTPTQNINPIQPQANPTTTTTDTPPPSPRNKSFFANLVDKVFLKSNQVKNQSPVILIGMVFILGLLHTLEAGHSKAILASSMLNKGMSFKRGMIYVFVFTATHLGDIVIVGLLFMAVNNFYSVFSQFTLIEKFAGYAVFFLAIYMLIKSLTEYIRNMVVGSEISSQSQQHDHSHRHNDHDQHHHDHTHEDHGHTHNEDILTSKTISFKEQILMGILTGLAPCIFGWSIFMLVISTGRIWLLFPVILSFGLGIFVALTVVAGIISTLKSAAYGKISKLAEISPIISALFLLIYAIFLIA